MTPTRDRQALLQRALRSLLAQRCTEWEWIVVDDGSADDLSHLLLPAGDRLVLLRNPISAGAAAARNRGIAAARAPLVAFLDDDDEYEPGFLGSVVAAFARAPQAEFCMTGALRCYADARVRSEPFDADPAGHDFLRRASASRGLCARTEALRRCGGFDPTLPVSEDVDLLLRMAEAGARPVFVREPLVRIHEHAGPSLSRGASAAQHAAASQRLWQRHKEFFRARRSLWRHYGGVLAANLYRAGRRDEARAALRELASHPDAWPRALEIWWRFEGRLRAGAGGAA